MPVYLAHGFRWPRDGFTGIRVHAIVNNLEDMAVEYIQSDQTKAILRKSFRELHPSLMQQLEDSRTGKTIEFLEEYDPEDERGDEAVSKKHAFVCDRIVTLAAGINAVPGQAKEEETARTQPSLRVPSNGRPPTASSTSSPHGKKSSSNRSTASSPHPHHVSTALSLNVEDAMSSGPAVTPQAWEAFAELRDKLAEGEKIGWWIIYNGDPERTFYDDEESTSSDYGEEAGEEGARTPTQADPTTNGILGKPLPSMIPQDLKYLMLQDSHNGVEAEENEKSSIGMAIPHPPPPLQKPPPVPEGTTPSRPKSSRSFTNPLRRRSSKANLQPPKDEHIPEPPKLNELVKKEGLRQKFFGRASTKK